MKHYAKINRYGTNTQTGFSNTWEILAFCDKTCRDKFINDNYDNMSVGKIRKNQITDYLSDSPPPFSGQCYAITTPYDQEKVDGLIGYVAVCHPAEYHFVQRLF